MELIASLITQRRRKFSDSNIHVLIFANIWILVNLGKVWMSVQKKFTRLVKFYWKTQFLIKHFQRTSKKTGTLKYFQEMGFAKKSFDFIASTCCKLGYAYIHANVSHWIVTLPFSPFATISPFCEWFRRFSRLLFDNKWSLELRFEACACV